jgi:cysteine desulfurase
MDPTKTKTILSLSTEHKCVIESVRYLKNLGFKIKFLPVLETGLVDLNLLEEELNHAALLSVSYINNETGVIQDMPAISKLCRKKNVCLHVDGAQAFGKINIDARDVDLLSISGHKIYGPKGIGALFVSKTPRIRLSSLISGGGQERGMRSGTLATPLCVGLAACGDIAKEKMQEDYNRAKKFEAQIIEQVIETIPNLAINGTRTQKIPHILNISVPYVEGESLLMRMNDFALSSGSACTSKSLEPSHVISAMHPEEKDLAHSSIRICFGRYSTQENVDLLIGALKKHICELRELSPLWSMVQKGIDLKTIKWA